MGECQLKLGSYAIDGVKGDEDEGVSSLSSKLRPGSVVHLETSEY